MSDVIENTVEALDEVFGRGYAQKNPSLIGMVMIHDAIVGLTNSFTVTVRWAASTIRLIISPRRFTR
jgi:hypothetical protein